MSDDDDCGTRLVDALPRMRRYALAVCRDPHQADDLVQAACERALASRGPSNADTPWLAWLFTIIRNLWIDRQRRKHNEGTQTDIDEQADLLPGAGGEDERVDVRQRLERVQQAITQLAPEQRELVLLVCVEEMSYAEAAAVTGVPIGTVMSRLARARIRLAQLAGLGSDDASSARMEP